MAGFVVGDCFLFFGGEDEGFLFETADDALDGLFEVDHCYGFGTCTGSCMLLAFMKLCNEWESVYLLKQPRYSNLRYQHQKIQE